ncbi:MAG: hypothetical protein P8Y84_13455 [Desulfuromonadales bacterium]
MIINSQTCQQIPTREYSRFNTLPRALVFFPNDAEYPLPFHLIDISEGGLSFRYLGDKREQTESSTISLYHENDLIVENLPVQEVSDILLEDGLVPVRRKSVSFRALNAKQMKHVSTFMNRFTSTTQ